MKKKNEKCEETMNVFFSLDKHSVMPIKISFHLIKCKQCRSQVRALTMAEKASSVPLEKHTSNNDEMVLAIMNRIDTGYKVKEHLKPVTMTKWIVSGILMILAFLAFTIFDFDLIGKSISVQSYLVFAFAITIYCVMFVFSNIDFFIKKIDKNIGARFEDLH